MREASGLLLSSASRSAVVASGRCEACAGHVFDGYAVIMGI